MAEPPAQSPEVRAALAADRTVDITTRGRRSGEPRRIETWFYRAGERFYLTGTPGRRSWYANLAADPEFTFHLKESATADLPARGRLVTEPEERGEIFAALLPGLGRESELGAWLDGSPLVEIEFTA